MKKKEKKTFFKKGKYKIKIFCILLVTRENLKIKSFNFFEHLFENNENKTENGNLFYQF